MRVLLETDNALVGLDEQKKAIVVIWSDNPSKKEFEQVYSTVLKAFKIYFVNRLVNDFAKLPQLHAFQEEHLVHDILPMARKCGLKKLVNVSTDPAIVKKLTESIHKTFYKDNRPFELENYRSFSEAFEKIAV